ncbi:angiotensinogen [Lacerta agilis]|uniref:angiotensinogen n=1 Tax=Lacerta agilis TaxID=80427 RepID=UPI001419E1EE|nr:angiotensinogen [Lacerta agilis]XP_033000142.1 angiotensinogen [Lacerta agilis]XP_033000143.1 angiotensinogen [Lacerta agilis]XP_033000144.1 angiotensinogen [Lacerta agilis]
MNPGVSLLCFVLCLTIVGCDRVYVHPFYLFDVGNLTGCKVEEDREQQVNNFVPVSNLSHIISAHEEGVRNKSEGSHLRKELRDPIHIIGARFYEQLRKMHKEENILLSPTFSYESLLAFYIGASGETAKELQTFLGFDSTSVNPNCTYRIDGRKVFSVLSSIAKSPFHSKEDDQLFFSKFSWLFSAPEIRLSESFVSDLAFPNMNFFVRAVDFTNPTKAAEEMNAFVEAKSTHRSKNLLADIDPETNLLLATYTHFKVSVKGASLLKEPQEFWLSSHKTIPVPMMRITGTFQHKCDPSQNISSIKIPLSQDLFLLLLQPTNNSDLASVESQYSMKVHSNEWLVGLSPRQIQLTLPKVCLESTYDIQELLGKTPLSYLLGNKANLARLSDNNITVGKIINQQLLELTPRTADEATDPTERSQDTEALKITLDKPFLLAVYEMSGAQLYFGRITNPLKGT